jgi:hypothetical protein
MRRVRLFLLATVAVVPASANDALLRGNGAFAEGRGTISFEAGWVDIGLSSIRPDGLLIIDGAVVDYGGSAEHVYGDRAGGRLSFLLPGEDDGGWFGRNLRLGLQYARDRGEAVWSDFGVPGPTIVTNLSFITASLDGRAVASSSNDINGAIALARAVGFGSGVSDNCAFSDGNSFVSGSATSDGAAVAGCAVSTTTASSSGNAQDANGADFTAVANATALPGPVATTKYAAARNVIDIRRGEVGFEGDYDLSPSVTLSPSLGVTVASSKSDIIVVQGLSSAFLQATQVLSGRIATKDAGVAAGLRANHAFGGGFAAFAGVRAALVRRKTDFDLDSLSFITVNGDDTFANSSSDAHDEFEFLRTETIAAFQGGLEAGASYAFNSGFIGPVRFAVSGDLLWDSRVPTYRNVALEPVLDLAAPVGAARIGYTDEITLAFKAEVTFELP